MSTPSPTSDPDQTTTPGLPTARLERPDQRTAAQIAEAGRQRTVAIVVTLVVLALVAAAVVFLTWHYRSQQSGPPAAGGTATTTASAADTAGSAAASSSAPAPTGAAIVPPHLTADASAIAVAGPSPKPGALVVDIHMDYQCPYCKQYEQAFGPAVDQLVASGDIVVNYHIRSFLDRMIGNDSSVRAGVGATCADTVGAFVPYHEAVFANQPASEGAGYTDDQLRSAIAVQAGLSGDNLAKFQACYDAQATAGIVTSMETINAGNALVQGTPTYLSNGKVANVTTSDANVASLLATLQAAAAS